MLFFYFDPFSNLFLFRTSLDLNMGNLFLIAVGGLSALVTTVSAGNTILPRTFACKYKKFNFLTIKKRMTEVK